MTIARIGPGLWELRSERYTVRCRSEPVSKNAVRCSFGGRGLSRTNEKTVAPPAGRSYKW